MGESLGSEVTRSVVTCLGIYRKPCACRISNSSWRHQQADIPGKERVAEPASPLKTVSANERASIDWGWEIKLSVSTEAGRKGSRKGERRETRKRKEIGSRAKK